MTATIQRLSHVNLRTARLAAMTAWYDRVLGMRAGPRPGLASTGAWLYADGQPLIHLVATEAAPAADPADLRIEHFAFSASGLRPMLERLAADDERHRLRPIDDIGVLQVNLWDPDGNHIHVDFDLAEAEGLEITF